MALNRSFEISNANAYIVRTGAGSRKLGLQPFKIKRLHFMKRGGGDNLS